MRWAYPFETSPDNLDLSYLFGIVFFNKKSYKRKNTELVYGYRKTLLFHYNLFVYFTIMSYNDVLGGN